jgi:hypothetical protein
MGRQLLLVDAGHAGDAKILLEQRLEHLLSRPSIASLGPANSSDHNNHSALLKSQRERQQKLPFPSGVTDQELEVDIKASSKCFIIDVLCEGLKDFDTAEQWLMYQQDNMGDLHGGDSVPACPHSRNFLGESEVKDLLSKVEAKRGAAAAMKSPTLKSAAKPFTSASASATRVNGFKPLPSAAVPPSMRSGEPSQSSLSKSGNWKPSKVWPELQPSLGGSDFFTMMGDMPDCDACKPLLSEENPSSEAFTSGSAVTALNSSANQSLMLGTQEKKSSSFSAVLRLLVWLISTTRTYGSYFFDQFKKRLAGGEGLGTLRKALVVMVSCALTLALVIESKTIVSATRAWWRQLRLALRTMMAELLSMGLVINPNPIRNGYSLSTVNQR